MNIGLLLCLWDILQLGDLKKNWQPAIKCEMFSWKLSGKLKDLLDKSHLAMDEEGTYTDRDMTQHGV